MYSLYIWSLVAKDAKSCQSRSPKSPLWGLILTLRQCHAA